MVRRPLATASGRGQIPLATMLVPVSSLLKLRFGILTRSDEPGRVPFWVDLMFRGRYWQAQVSSERSWLWLPGLLRSR